MLQKQARSPQSSEYLKTTPMSHSANLKRRQPLTPTLPKSFPPLTIQEDMISLELNPSILQLNLEKLTPEKPPRDNKTSKIQYLMMKMANLAKNRSYSKATCHGSPHPMTLLSPIATPVAKKPVGFSKLTTKTYPKPNSLSKSLLIPPPASLQLNGNESSKEMPLTSTKSLHHCTMLSLMKREWVAWETRKSFLESLNVRKESLLRQNGHQLGEKLPKPLSLHFLTREMNSLNTEITLNVSLLLNLSHHTTNLSSMISPSEMRLLEDNTRNSQTIINSPDFIPPLSSLMELKPIPGNPITRNLPYHKTTTGLKFATNSTSEHARTPIPIANIDTSAKTATSPAIPKRTAHLNPDEVHGLCYDFEPLSDNHLYLCLVLGKLLTVYSRCTWF